MSFLGMEQQQPAVASFVKNKIRGEEQDNYSKVGEERPWNTYRRNGSAASDRWRTFLNGSQIDKIQTSCAHAMWAWNYKLI